MTNDEYPADTQPPEDQVEDAELSAIDDEDDTDELEDEDEDEDIESDESRSDLT